MDCGTATLLALPLPPSPFFSRARCCPDPGDSLAGLCKWMPPSRMLYVRNPVGHLRGNITSRTSERANAVNDRTNERANEQVEITERPSAYPRITPTCLRPHTIFTVRSSFSLHLHHGSKPLCSVYPKSAGEALDRVVLVSRKRKDWMWHPVNHLLLR